MTCGHRVQVGWDIVPYESKEKTDAKTYFMGRLLISKSFLKDKNTNSYTCSKSEQNGSIFSLTLVSKFQTTSVGMHCMRPYVSQSLNQNRTVGGCLKTKEVESIVGSWQFPPVSSFPKLIFPWFMKSLIPSLSLQFS